MTGVALALLCAVFIAFSQISLRKSYRELKSSVAFLFDAVFGLVLWVPLALIMGVSILENFWSAVLFAVISAILSEAIVFFALSKGELAVTVTVLASYPVYTVIFSRAINHETLSPLLLALVAITILGSLIASSPDKIKKKELGLRKEIVWPFVAAVCIGLSDTLSKGFIDRSGDFSFLFMLGFVQVPIALAYLRIERQPLIKSFENVFKRLSAYRYAVLGGLFNIIGTGFLWLSFSYAPASIASPITGANGALTVVLARFVFTEKLRFKKYIGIALTFAGVIGISIVQS